VTDVELHCRVCGLEQSAPPWGADGTSPTFEICPCCGTEFGYEDGLPDAVTRARELWLKNGAAWFEPNARPPDWNVDAQLLHVPAKYR
jgi:hypothetical protein